VSPQIDLYPGFNIATRIYRSEEATGKDTIVTEVPADEIGPPHTQDSNFEWEKTYLYRITSVRS